MAKHYEQDKVYIECPFCGTSNEYHDGDIECTICDKIIPSAESFAFGLSFATKEAKELIAEVDKLKGEVTAMAKFWYDEAEKALKDDRECIATETGRTIERIHYESNGDKIITKSPEVKRRVVSKSIDYELVAGNYRRAAECGHIIAMRKLALMYWKGLGVSKNVKTSFSLLCKCALLGDFESRTLIIKGDEGIADYDWWTQTKGVMPCILAANDKGLKWAKYFLGVIYLNGYHGVEKDREKGLIYIHEAAADIEVPKGRWIDIDSFLAYVRGDDRIRSGYFLAKQTLSDIYFNGLFGEKQDVERAWQYIWRIPSGKNKVIATLNLFNYLDLWTVDRLKWPGGSMNTSDGFSWIDNIGSPALDIKEVKALVVAATEKYIQTNKVQWLSFIKNSDVEGIKKACNGFWDQYESGWPFIGKRNSRKPCGFFFTAWGRSATGEIESVHHYWWEILMSPCRIVERKEKRGAQKVIFSGNSPWEGMGIGSCLCSEADARQIGVNLEDLVDYFNYIRRYLLLMSRKSGVKLLDFSLQKTEQQQKPEDELTGSVFKEMYEDEREILRKKEEKEQNESDKREVRKSIWLMLKAVFLFLILRGQKSVEIADEVHRTMPYSYRWRFEIKNLFISLLLMLFRVSVMVGGVVGWNKFLQDNQMPLSDAWIIFGAYLAVSFALRESYRKERLLYFSIVSAALAITYFLVFSVLSIDKGVYAVLCLLLMIVATTYYMRKEVWEMKGGTLMFVLLGFCTGLLSAPAEYFNQLPVQWKWSVHSIYGVIVILLLCKIGRLCCSIHDTSYRYFSSVIKAFVPIIIAGAIWYFFGGGNDGTWISIIKKLISDYMV